MIVRKLALENFLSYRSAELEFPRGAVAIIGENGAGKSTLLDAVCFALFRDAGRGSTLTLIRRGASQSRVTLEFQVDNASYIVVREIKISGKNRVSTSAKLYRVAGGDRQLVAYSPLQVDEELKRILGIDKQMFLTTVYVRQGEIAKLLDVDPHQRKALIARLLGIDRLEKAYSNMLLLIKHFEQERLKMEGRLALLEQLEKLYLDTVNEMERVKRDIAETENAIGQARKLLSAAEQRFEGLRGQVERLAAVRSELTRLEERRKALEGRRNDLATRLRDAVNAGSELAKAKELLAYEPIVEELLRLTEEAERRRERVLDWLKEVDTLRRNLVSEDVDAMRRLRADLASCRERLGEIENNLAALEKTLSSLKFELDYYCSRCEEVLGTVPETSRIIPELDAKRREVEKRLREINDEENVLLSRLKTVEARLAQVNQWISGLREAEQRCPLCESPLDEGRRKHLIERYTAEAGLLEGERARLLSQLNELKSDEEKLQELSRRLGTIDVERLAQIMRAVDEAQSSIQSLRSERAAIAERLRRLDIEPSLKALDNFIAGMDDKISRALASQRIAQHLAELEERISGERRAINELEERIRGLSSGLGPLGPVKAVSETIKQYKGRVELLEKQVSQIPLLEREILSINEALAELEKRRAELERQHEELSKSEEEAGRLEREISDIRGRISALQSRLHMLLERLKELGAKAEDMRAKLREAEALKLELKDLDKFIDLLKSIREVIGKDGVQRDLRARAKPLIERYLSSFAALFNLDFLDVRLSDDYDVLVIDAEGARSIDTVSGGEKVALALALRLAIAKALSGGRLMCMLLDEPTIHLDEERRARLVDAIRRLFGAGGREFPQLILVTHERELEQAADMVINVRKTPRGSIAVPLTAAYQEES